MATARRTIRSTTPSVRRFGTVHTVKARNATIKKEDAKLQKMWESNARHLQYLINYIDRNYDDIDYFKEKKAGFKEMLKSARTQASATKYAKNIDVCNYQIKLREERIADAKKDAKYYEDKLDSIRFYRQTKSKTTSLDDAMVTIFGSKSKARRATRRRY